MLQVRPNKVTLDFSSTNFQVAIEDKHLSLPRVGLYQDVTWPVRKAFVLERLLMEVGICALLDLTVLNNRALSTLLGELNR